MTSRPLSELYPEFAGHTELDRARATSYPFANVALAVARLRGEHGLTQTQFAERIGTTQPVIARLESGRHGIQISLLNRIAAAFDVDWQVTFGDESAAAGDPGDHASPSTVSSGDQLLDGFNAENLAGSHAAAHAWASKIRKDPSSPRRKLAVALDEFNRRNYLQSLKWGRAALAGDLPAASAQVARIVAGRSLLALAKTDEALVMLATAGDSEVAVAARAEALMEAGRNVEAIDLAERFRKTADKSARAAAEFLAARVYWHADKPFRALFHIGAFRAERPTDREGVLLHGAVLGFIGDLYDDRESHEGALSLFTAARQDDDPESLRLSAMAASRLGRWQDAFSWAQRAVELAGPAQTTFREAASRVAAEVFDRLDDPAELESAADAAVAAGLIDGAEARSQRAFARALRGDFDGAVEALGLKPSQLPSASTFDQVRCAIAYVRAGVPAEALPILSSAADQLPIPDGQLLLAQSALAAADTRAAKGALRRVAKGDGAAAQTASLALELVRDIEMAGAKQILAIFKMSSAPTGARDLTALPAVSAASSVWEGPSGTSGEPAHDPASRVIDRFSSGRLSAQMVH
jgi:transcriptional regulator with XRE-family HTH domain